jgi:cellulose synthase/poly-beta-1,6-N-acetylglucosamine synthase-like glycosyltransferase
MAEALRRDISIIIPCYNAAGYLTECLAALNQQSMARDRYEVIVVDDGSTDNTAQVAEGVCDRCIRTPNRGSAAARNRGVRESTGSVLLFTDADCVPRHDWIEKMTVPFDDPEISGVKGVYRTRQAGLVARFVQAEYEVKYSRMIKQVWIDFVDTYSAGFRRYVFTGLGGFDERYPGASVEDQEFSFRVAEAGYRMVFVPDAVVWHRHADSLGRYFRKKMNIGYWKVLVLKRHPGKLVRDSHTPQLLKLQLPIAFLMPATLLMAPFTTWIPFYGVAGVFLVAGGREILHCYRRYGIVLAACSPVILWVRSTGLGLGLLQGLVHSMKRSPV